jgi:hypothetical protein
MSVCARRDINKTALLCPDNFNNDDSSMVCMEYGGRRNRPQADRAGVCRVGDAGGKHISVSHLPRTLSSDLDVGLAGIFSIELDSTRRQFRYLTPRIGGDISS